MKKLQIATICSGIGAPEKALYNLGIEYELAYFCEVDKYASKSYEAIHGEPASKNLGDLTAVEIAKLPKCLDLLVGGTPCQDFSVAGKRAGGEADSGTRSSLMWNFVEIIRQTKPRVVLWENVPGILTSNMKYTFSKFTTELRSIGYVVHTAVLNSKDFGVPQNRERVFVIAIHNAAHCEKDDINIAQRFSFAKMPKGYYCGVTMNDALDQIVDEKYYISDVAKKRLLGKGIKYSQIDGDVSCTQTARQYANANGQFVTGKLIALTDNAPQGNRIYDPSGLGATLSAQGGGVGAKTGLYRVPHGFNKGGYSEVDTCPAITTSAFQENNFIACAMRGRENGQQIEVGDNVANAVTTVQKDSMAIQNDRVCKLTPRECFRLMGFTDADYQSCKDAEISDSQLYKQAGNSIVVNVLMAIFGQLYDVPWHEKIYGKWWKTEAERMADLPLLQSVGGGT